MDKEEEAKVVQNQGDDMSFEITKKSKVDAIDYLTVLMEEVAIQRSRLLPHDTGHIHTTISVLETRIEEIKDKIRADLHST